MQAYLKDRAINRQVNQLYIHQIKPLYKSHSLQLALFFCTFCAEFIFIHLYSGSVRRGSVPLSLFPFNTTVMKGNSLRKKSWVETQKGAQPLLGHALAFKSSNAFWVSCDPEVCSDADLFFFSFKLQKRSTETLRWLEHSIKGQLNTVLFTVSHVWSVESQSLVFM